MSRGRSKTFSLQKLHKNEDTLDVQKSGDGTIIHETEESAAGNAAVADNAELDGK